jgi:hypothetical protein
MIFLNHEFDFVKYYTNNFGKMNVNFSMWIEILFLTFDFKPFYRQIFFLTLQSHSNIKNL